MLKLILTVGLPGSGKSTWAKNQNLPIISSDKIREKLYGDEKIQGNPKKVFNLFYKMAEKHLRLNKDVILDATNLNVFSRKQAIELGKKYNTQIIAIVFETPIRECIRRQELRDRKVPTGVIENMAKKYEEPTIDEGFTKIIKI